MEIRNLKLDIGNPFNNLYAIIICKLFPLWGLGGLFFLLFSGCKKEVDNSLIETNSFIKVFSEAGDQRFQYIKQTDDNGFIILGTGNDSLFILKINEGGLLQWKKNVSNMDIIDMVATDLKNGDILVSSIS